MILLEGRDSFIRTGRPVGVYSEYTFEKYALSLGYDAL
jgi:hypothetical protein